MFHATEKEKMIKISSHRGSLFALSPEYKNAKQLKLFRSDVLA